VEIVRETLTQGEAYPHGIECRCGEPLYANDIAYYVVDELGYYSFPHCSRYCARRSFESEQEKERRRGNETD
jgi:hypothetical protein